MERKNKTIACLIVLFLIVLGVLFYGLKQLHSLSYKQEFALFLHNEINSDIKSTPLVLNVPEDATNLFYVRSGMIGHKIRLALSLVNQEHCKLFLQEQFGLTLDQFNKGAEVPDVFLKAELKDTENWDIKKWVL